MRTLKIAATAILAAAVAAGCASAAGLPAAAASRAPSTAAAVSPAAVSRAARPQAARIVAWSVNSDGADFRAIATGAVGDSGPAVTVHPDGTVDPEHTSELELNLTEGSFRVSIAKLAATFRRAVASWPGDKGTCSIQGSVTSAAPIVAGSGTGAYRGITGTFTLTITLYEDWAKQTCSETNGGFQAQLLLIEGSGSVRL